MFIDELSRYRAAQLVKSDDGGFFWQLPAQFEYSGEDEDIFYEIQSGDNWHLIAQKFYGSDFGGSKLWWAIMDYQPVPRLDPTIALTPGEVIVIPSPLAIQDFLLGPNPSDTTEGLK